MTQFPPSIGPYTILAKLGEGGMGVVYRARDTKLNRDVAIKVLPEAFALDADRLARFTREAQVLASLNHPNIAAIYGFEQGPAEAGRHIGTDVASGFSRTTALVMELVEGDDLSQRIRRGAIPLDEALPIARQIAEALEAAHEQGIVHRDLKPANIKVRPDGTVKVLDFGLAKAIEQAGGAGQPGGAGRDLENSPTITTPAMTMRGMILGTAAYMSPEQARGKAVDRRADIWAFGAVLYEVLTGRRAFEGAETSDVLAAVLRQDIDMTALPAETPESIRRLLTRCLTRDPKQRLADASTIRLDIGQALQEPSAPVSIRASAPKTRASWPLVAACGALALTTMVLAVMLFREPAPVLPAEMRLDIATPATTWGTHFELSPDGQRIVFVAPGEKAGVSRLWVRRLDRTDAQLLAGTDDARWPFWSPDSRSIGFSAGGKLRRIDVTGGASTTLADFEGVPFGGAWNADGVILFRSADGLFRVNASGGTATKLVTNGGEGLAPRHPQFLPDGRHFVFFVYTGSGTRTGLYLASLDAPTPKFLGASDSTARWLEPNRLLLVEQGKLVARPLDLARGEFVGDAQTVADGIGEFSGGHGGFSASTRGLVAYRPQLADAESHLVWLDRTGAPAGTPIDLAGPVSALEISPDGTRLALDLAISGNRDVWISDLERGGLTRFTFDAAVDGYPVWSPDGRTIAFESARKGDFDIYAKASSGAGSEEVWLEAPGNQWPYAFFNDGKLLLHYNRGTAGDLLALPLGGGNRTSIPIATTPFPESQGTPSPDGKWVAYTTSESGRPEVVVQAFPAASGKWQVSTGGGDSPRWSVNGRELYFMTSDSMMAASVRAGGSSFDVAPPVKLFAFPVRTLSFGTPPPQYAVDRRGRFLINSPRETAVTTPITLLLNWRAGTP